MKKDENTLNIGWWKIHYVIMFGPYSIDESLGFNKRKHFLISAIIAEEDSTNNNFDSYKSSEDYYINCINLKNRLEKMVYEKLDNSEVIDLIKYYDSLKQEIPYTHLHEYHSIPQYSFARRTEYENKEQREKIIRKFISQEKLELENRREYINILDAAGGIGTNIKILNDSRFKSFYNEYEENLYSYAIENNFIPENIIKSSYAWGLLKYIYPEKFDMILLIGSALPRLRNVPVRNISTNLSQRQAPFGSEAALTITTRQKTLESFKSILRPGGVILLDIRNFDKIEKIYIDNENYGLEKVKEQVLSNFRPNNIFKHDVLELWPIEIKEDKINGDNEIVFQYGIKGEGYDHNPSEDKKLYVKEFNLKDVYDDLKTLSFQDIRIFEEDTLEEIQPGSYPEAKHPDFFLIYAKKPC